jgi:hypothetical protein
MCSLLDRSTHSPADRLFIPIYLTGSGHTVQRLETPSCFCMDSEYVAFLPFLRGDVDTDMRYLDWPMALLQFHLRLGRGRS